MPVNSSWNSDLSIPSGSRSNASYCLPLGCLCNIDFLVGCRRGGYQFVFKFAVGLSSLGSLETKYIHAVSFGRGAEQSTGTMHS